LRAAGRLESETHSRTMTFALFYQLLRQRVRTMRSKTRTGRYARLKEPLVREGNKLCPVGWNEALDRTARGLRETIDRHGPHALGMFSCSKTTNELNFVAQKFARVVIGSNNIDSCNRT
jgi:formate dehydrogenase (hydrogenase)